MTLMTGASGDSTHDLTRPRRPVRWFALMGWSCVLVGFAAVLYVLFFRESGGEVDVTPAPAPGQVRRTYSLGPLGVSLLLDDDWSVALQPKGLRAVLGLADPADPVMVDWRVLPESEGTGPRACAEQWLRTTEEAQRGPVRVFRSRWLDRPGGIEVCELVLGEAVTGGAETDRAYRVYLEAGARVILVTFDLSGTTALTVDDRIQTLISSSRF